jgi:hypothetical protein
LEKKLDEMHKAYEKSEHEKGKLYDMVNDESDNNRNVQNEKNEEIKSLKSTLNE